MKITYTSNLSREARNIFFVTAKLLQLLKVKITSSALRRSLLSHPNYLSLLSISETLQQFKIKTTGLNVSLQELNEIKCPFIMFFSAGKKFVVAKEAVANGVYYYDEATGKVEFKSLSDLSKVWRGVVLIAEPTSESGERDYKKNKRKELVHEMRIPALLMIFLITGILKIANLTIGQPESLYFSLLFLCKFVGVIVTLLLLLYEYDKDNSLTKQLCSIGKKTNCEAVLHSQVSTVGGVISWSEAGFIYFLGGLLTLLLAGEPALGILFWLNVLALPYILFSLYYQAIKIRQWCVLCLTVQILLLSELFSAFIAYRQVMVLDIQVPVNLLLLSFIAFFLPAWVWFFAKSYIYSAKTGMELEFQMARFKNNPEIFFATLLKQPFVVGNPDGLGILLGNPSAENTLIKVCNPYCGPCAKAHPKIDALIRNNPNWKAQIIFSVKAKEVSHLMAIAEEFEKENKPWLKHEMLHDWYRPDKKVENRYTWFLNKFPVKTDVLLQEKKIEAMFQWCQENAISYTPTFFVNGYRLPDQYEVTDLQHF